MNNKEIVDDEIDLLQLLKRSIELFKLNKVTVVSLFIATVSLGILFGLSQNKLYTSEVKLIPYQNSSSSRSSTLSGLAGLAGISLGSDASGQVLSVTHYPDLLKSHNFIFDVIQSPIYFGQKNKSISYYDYRLQYEQNSFLGEAFLQLKKYTIGLPGLIFRTIVPTEKIAELNVSEIPIDLKVLDEDYFNILEDFENKVSIVVNDKTGVISITAQMPDPFAAASMANLVSEKLKRSIIVFETKKIDENLVYIESQFTNAKERYQNAQRSLATFSNKNRGTFNAVDQIELQRLQSDFNLAFDIYKNFASEFESSKLKKEKETPSFSILQSAIVPIHPSSPKLKLIFVISIILGFILSIGYIFFLDFFNNIKVQWKENN